MNEPQTKRPARLDAGHKRAVLLVSLLPPDHEGTGTARREAYLIDALAKHVSVDVVAPEAVTDPNVIVRTRNLYVAEAAPFHYGRRAAQLMQLRALLGLGPPRSVQVHAQITRAIASAVPDWSSYDAVCIDWPEVVPLVHERSDNAWVLTFQYLESRQALQRREVARGFWARARARVAVLPTRSFERWTLTAFDAVFVTSPDDADALGGRALLAPNGVDCDMFRPSPLPRQPRLIMTGSLGWEPNIVGAIWFARHVFPLVRDRLPDATLQIVGFNPPPSVLDLAAIPGVSIHGSVPTVVPYLAAARVALVPLHVGSGTRLKALEAMAMGRPVVGTAVGLEGLGITDGREAAMADEPDAMSRRIIELVEDDSLATRMGMAGRRLAESSYCWPTAMKPFVERVVQLAERREARTQ